MEYRENSLTYQEYVSLRSSVGWNNFTEEQVSNSISKSIYNITVVDDNRTIAMGRLIGDGIYYLIVDIVVNPEFQGNGIGSKIIDMLLAYVDDRTPIGGRSSVQLIAEQGKEEFYIKKGFKLIPHEFCGSGMRKIIRK
ncbi:MAG: GNAT family N-acetyltransferase [Agathobacter sp.]|nr:GNAT family N-acetyltransferase [Lachnobacterium sp.]MDY6156404.1 GNAT family N-acetyltransferase [Agathobacter sp.]